MTERRDAQRPLCRLLQEDPDLGEGLPDSLREKAIAYCLAPTLEVGRGTWDGSDATAATDGIGLLVLEGVLIRRVGINGRFGAEMLGAGDLLRPWQDEEGILRHTSGWRIVQPARLAILNLPVTARLARFPHLLGTIVGRAVNRSRQLAVMMAIIHHPRVEIRVHMLLWHLADRWGRVRREGVYVPLRLSHSLIGELVAAQRPSITVALHGLANRGLISPMETGWLLCGDPPTELLELQDVAVVEPAATAAC